MPEILHPAWSPDGQYIAFQADHIDGNCDIWAIHPDGSGLERMTTDSAADLHPQWSPDSGALYFLSFRSGARRLWKKDLATGAESRVADIALSDYAVSSDGSEFIIQTGRNGNVDLVIASALNGRDIRWLAASRDGEYTPAWSPDHQQAAFLKHENLWARSAVDRSNLRQLTNFTDEERVVGSISWGTSGFIAFDMDGKIYKVRPDSTGLTCVLDNGDPVSWAQDPTWSPGGTHLAFVRSVGGTQGLWIMNADGTGLSQVQCVAGEPAFEPGAGTYATTQSVAITCPTTGATIRYTTDETEPTESSAEYTSAVTIDKSTTLKARAWKSGLLPGYTHSATYELKVATPSFDPDGGTYSGAQSVTITCDTSDVTVRYTTDGTEPDENSAEYAGLVLITEDSTLKAKAWKTDWTDSDVKSADYVIQ
ncbi:MAG: chitobiase/beta-hexosaminidase C-terminal domain-containing protein [Armatimonadetes bacterium]|nr:chitobiase/beta-hexosaminidase C-terminal domain-containing protein [Armatimonadota bacterium]